MTTLDIKKALNEIGYEDIMIKKTGDKTFKITVVGECHIQAVKDILPIGKWEYDNNKVLFWI